MQYVTPILEILFWVAVVIFSAAGMVVRSEAKKLNGHSYDCVSQLDINCKNLCDCGRKK